MDVDVVLVAVGRRPVTEGLGLDKIGVEVDNKGRIVVDDQYNTTVKGIKCIGDATFGPMLAHKAEEEGTFPLTTLIPSYIPSYPALYLLSQPTKPSSRTELITIRYSGIAAVEIIKTGHGHVNYGAIPAVIYTHPEVAWTGKNEQELKEAGVKYKVSISCLLSLSLSRVVVSPLYALQLIRHLLLLLLRLFFFPDDTLQDY